MTNDLNATIGRTLLLAMVKRLSYPLFRLGTCNVAGDFEPLKISRAVRNRCAEILCYIGTTQAGSQGLLNRGAGKDGRRPGVQRRRWAQANRPKVG